MPKTRLNTAKWLPAYNRWQIKVQKDGVRKTFYSSTPGRAGQAECNRKADDWLTREGLSDDVRVQDAWADWITELKSTTSYDHWTQYEGYGRRYVLPRLGLSMVSHLDDAALQDCINDAFARRGLAQKTLSNLRGCLKAFVKYCRRRKLTTYVPDDISLPNSAAKGKRTIFMPEDLRVLFANDLTTYYGTVRPDWYINVYRAQVVGGLRPGELIGLQSKDDLGFALAVSGSVNVHGVHTDGKNENAHRSVTVSPLLRRVLDDQAAMLKAAGVKSAYLFPDRAGKPTVERQYRRALERYCTYHDLPPVTPYELRHTFVSAVKNLPEGLIKGMVGHSESMDTYGVYAHEIQGDEQQRAKMLEDVFEQLLSPKQ